MTQEQKRIAIAEACGWRDVSWTGPEPRTVFDELIGRPKHVSDEDSWCEVPDYFNGLNAIREAEKTVGLHDRSKTLLRIKWINKLRDVVGIDCPKNKSGSPLCSDVDLVNASAAQRAEAFGLTLGLWT